MSFIHAAYRYAEMQQSGLSIAQIGAKLGVDSGVIQERLQLLVLTPEEQDRVKKNQLSYVQALRLCAHRRRSQNSQKASVDTPQPSYEPAVFGFPDAPGDEDAVQTRQESPTALPQP